MNQLDQIILSQWRNFMGILKEYLNENRIKKLTIEQKSILYYLLRSYRHPKTDDYKKLEYNTNDKNQQIRIENIYLYANVLKFEPNKHLHERSLKIKQYYNGMFEIPLIFYENKEKTSFTSTLLLNIKGISYDSKLKRIDFNETITTFGTKYNYIIALFFLPYEITKGVFGTTSRKYKQFDVKYYENAMTKLNSIITNDLKVTINKMDDRIVPVFVLYDNTVSTAFTTFSIRFIANETGDIKNKEIVCLQIDDYIKTIEKKLDYLFSE